MEYLGGGGMERTHGDVGGMPTGGARSAGTGATSSGRRCVVPVSRGAAVPPFSLALPHQSIVEFLGARGPPMKNLVHCSLYQTATICGICGVYHIGWINSSVVRG